MLASGAGAGRDVGGGEAEEEVTDGLRGGARRPVAPAVDDVGVDEAAEEARVGGEVDAAEELGLVPGEGTGDDLEPVDRGRAVPPVAVVEVCAGCVDAVRPTMPPLLVRPRIAFGAAAPGAVGAAPVGGGARRVLLAPRPRPRLLEALPPPLVVRPWNGATSSN